ncbi:MAG TPA: hypothetical protein VM869_22290 [Enhygromyxa sp.]|nr:hypothetical protein [Enhygromyxa sp.]
MANDGDGRRFCDICTKHVHDLSAMTEPMARAVLASESAKGRVCVRYTSDSAGNIKFKAETVEAPSLWRMTLAAAGMALALFTTGCADSDPDRVMNDKCVYEVGPWSFTAERGQGTCPAVEPEPEELLMGELEAVIDPPAPEPMPERMGDIAVVPEPDPIPMMGAVAPPVVEEPPPRPEHVTMGKIAPVEPVEIEVKGELAVEQPCDPKVL